ncbi:hypothetical protein AX14_007774 [Amanita brunnescens Koide BX004]|nr:hypothetical protein AX14_007774 [Amanita brunnescens Koide BX004]
MLMPYTSVKANGTGTTMTTTLSAVDDSTSTIKMDEDIMDIPTPLVVANLDGVATAMGSMLELGMNKHNDVNNDTSGTSNPDNSEYMNDIPTSKLLVSATPSNDRSEIPDLKISIMSSTPVDHPQKLNLTNKQMVFAIASALSAVNTSSSDGPVITQEQPPKVQRKRSVKKAVVKQASPEQLPTASSAKPVKRKW